MLNLMNAVNFFGITLDLNAEAVLVGILISQVLLAIINIFAVAIVLTRISVSKAVQKNAAFTPRKSVVEAKDGMDVLLTATAPQNVTAEELAWFIDGKKTEISGFTYLFHATEGTHEITVAAGEQTVSEMSVFVTAAENAPKPAPEVVEEPAPEEEPAPVEEPVEEPAPEPVPEEEPTPEPVVILAEEPAGEPLLAESEEARYDFSFTARLIRSEDEVKGWYGAIKNELLSYNKVKERMSWRRETFKQGRDKVLARIAFRGKTLCVYLPLDASEFAESKYKLEEAGDMALYRIRSERRAKYCRELIALAAERLELTRTEREPADYYLPAESIPQLLAEGLAKQIAGEPAPFEEPAPAEEPVEEPAPVEEPVEEPAPEVVEEPIEEPVTESEPAPVEEPVEEPAPVEEPVEEPAPAEEPEPAEEAVEETAEETAEPEEAPVILTEEEEGTATHYDLSFTARLIRSEDEVKGWYGAIKNELLSYNKVKERMSWRRETFKRGHNVLARITFRGKTLCVYLPLAAAEFAESKYKLEASGDAEYSLYRIRSERRAKYCKELIALTAERLEIARTEREAEDYYLPAKSLEELVEEGLAKPSAPTAPAYASSDEAAPSEA